MEGRNNARAAGLGIALALLLGGLEALAADAPATGTDAKAAAPQVAGKDTKAPVERALKERGSETAAPLLERAETAETAEAKAKRLRYVQAMKANRAATARMDAAYMKKTVEWEQAQREAEKAGKTSHSLPVEIKPAK